MADFCRFLNAYLVRIDDIRLHWTLHKNLLGDPTWT